jgi:hypothetical protein
MSGLKRLRHLRSDQEREACGHVARRLSGEDREPPTSVILNRLGRFHELVPACMFFSTFVVQWKYQNIFL